MHLTHPEYSGPHTFRKQPLMYLGNHKNWSKCCYTWNTMYIPRGIFDHLRTHPLKYWRNMTAIACQDNNKNGCIISYFAFLSVRLHAQNWTQMRTKHLRIMNIFFRGPVHSYINLSKWLSSTFLAPWVASDLFIVYECSPDVQLICIAQSVTFLSNHKMSAVSSLWILIKS